MHESLGGGDRTKRVSLLSLTIGFNGLVSWAVLVVALVLIGRIIFDSPIAAAVAAAKTWNQDTILVVAAVSAACAAAVIVSRLTAALWQSNKDRGEVLVEARATRERIRRMRDGKPSDRTSSH